MRQARGELRFRPHAWDALEFAARLPGSPFRASAQPAPLPAGFADAFSASQAIIAGIFCSCLASVHISAHPAQAIAAEREVRLTLPTVCFPTWSARN
jgi:hypothetical protein